LSECPAIQGGPSPSGYRQTRLSKNLYAARKTRLFLSGFFVKQGKKRGKHWFLSIIFNTDWRKNHQKQAVYFC
jgi:hypothetical protein